MTSELPAHHHARLMAELDEPVRNALIEQADNVIDIRAHCESMRLYGQPISMPFPWIALDDDN